MSKTVTLSSRSFCYSVRVDVELGLDRSYPPERVLYWRHDVPGFLGVRGELCAARLRVGWHTHLRSWRTWRTARLALPLFSFPAVLVSFVAHVYK